MQTMPETYLKRLFLGEEITVGSTNGCLPVKNAFTGGFIINGNLTPEMKVDVLSTPEMMVAVLVQVKDCSPLRAFESFGVLKGGWGCFQERSQVELFCSQEYKRYLAWFKRNQRDIKKASNEEVKNKLLSLDHSLQCKLRLIGYPNHFRYRDGKIGYVVLAGYGRPGRLKYIEDSSSDDQVRSAEDGCRYIITLQQV